jgi:hypothetical protein
MEVILERILNHPLLSFALALLCILLLFAVLKGLIKLIILVLVFGALYFSYVSFLQDDFPLPEIDEGLTEQWNEWIEPYRSLDLNVTFSDFNQTLKGITNSPEQD